MKPNPQSTLLRRLTRPVLPLLAVLAAVVLSSCGSEEPPVVDHAAEIRRLEVRLDEFGNQLLAVAAHADRAAFWQTVAAVLLLAGGIAFVGGAAIGSKARRERAAELAVYSEPLDPRENGSRPHRDFHSNRSNHPNHNHTRSEHPAPRLHEPTA